MCIFYYDFLARHEQIVTLQRIIGLGGGGGGNNYVLTFISRLLRTLSPELIHKHVTIVRGVFHILRCTF